MKTPKTIANNRLLPAGLVVAGLAGLAVLWALLFPESARNLFNPHLFMPHAHCYFDNPAMIALHVVSDTLIWLAYVSISATLAYMVLKARHDIPFHWMFLAFGLFIVSCGFTHFMEVVTVWHALYWLAGGVKVVTALASVGTAIALVPLVPRIFALIGDARVSEQRRVNLAAANQELEAFASSIAHDLRAPLRAVQGLAVSLKEDYGAHPAPEVQLRTQRIIAAAERMDQLIQDLLAYSRTNLAAFQFTTLDLKAVVDEAITSLEVTIQESQAEIVLEGNFPAIVSDRMLLGQVVTNLLTNAIKFVAAGVKPAVKIQAEVVGNQVRLSFRDNGIGIAPEHLDRIFGIFERLHTEAEYPGTGVGLAIVKRAVSRLGGNLALVSHPGQGSCFSVELPRTPVAANTEVLPRRTEGGWLRPYSPVSPPTAASKG